VVEDEEDVEVPENKEEPPLCAVDAAAVTVVLAVVETAEETVVLKELVIDFMVSGTRVHAMAVKMHPRRVSRMRPFTLSCLASGSSCAI